MKLGKGKGIIGPEFFGCFNTGKRPVLFKAITGNKKFIVCNESELSEARRKNLFGAYLGKQVLDCEGGKAFVTDSYKSAKKRYFEMCQEITKFNEGEVKKVKELQKLTKAGKGYSIRAQELALDLN